MIFYAGTEWLGFRTLFSSCNLLYQVIKEPHIASLSKFFDYCQTEIHLPPIVGLHPSHAPGRRILSGNSLKKVGIEELHVSELDSFIGPPIQQSFVERYNMNEGEVERAVFYFREYLKQRGLLENKVYEDIPNLLKQLKDTGNRLFIATSKPTIFAEQVIEHFQLTNYFEGIIGSNLDGTRIKKKKSLLIFYKQMKNLIKKKLL